MPLSRYFKILSPLLAVVVGLLPLAATEHRGTVKFGGLPVPGATVTASQGDKKVATVTNADGFYSFPDLADGTWAMQVEMQLFSASKQDVAVAAGGANTEWELKLLSSEEIAKMSTTAPAEARYVEAGPVPAAVKNAATAKNSKVGNLAPGPTNTKSAFQRTELTASKQETARQDAAKQNPAAGDAPPQDALAAPDPELRQRASDGLLINGSVNNGAASPFAQFPAFGNNRRGQRSLYNGNLGLIVNNAAFDARSYSITGQDTAKPAYSKIQGLASFGGPFKIPHLLQRRGPNFTVNYQWTRNSNATTVPGLVPTAAERIGDFTNSLRTALDPSTGQPFANKTIPLTSISPQAKILLALYPQPNLVGNTRYNYQLPLVGGFHQDDLQARANKGIGRKDQVNGSAAWQRNRSDNTSLLGFLDTGRINGMNTQVNWRHNFSPRFFLNSSYQYSRQTIQTKPFFANRINVSGIAGITGNNQEPQNWGPPSLNFASGISGVSDAQSSLNRNQTSGVSGDLFFNRGRHNLTGGAGLRRQEFNVLSQQDPRGSFTFTGQAAGSDLAGLLLGIPDTASIAFGNADKYLRATNGELWFNDDWRMNPGFTLNYGLRWEYWGPVTEKYGRLVNMDIGPGFTTASPVVANQVDRSLVRSDFNNFAPRIAFSWRPFPASSMVVRGGYGVYYDTSIYQPIASQMAQQAPLSKSLRVDNTPANPLTLANGFKSPGGTSTTTTTFAVDPGFRLGYSQNWQLSVQRDLKWGMQMTATYMGIKGTRAQQQLLPNTFPAGAVNPCLTCPAGFTYLVSNGNSTREAGQFQLRRRLRSGLTAQVQYTFAKAIDDASLGGRQGGGLIAQNWLDLRGERGRSNFDQRHQISFQAQYTTGMGVRGGTLLSGWKGQALKEWTIGTQINAGTGLPLTPVYLAAVRGTGVTGSIRPDYTGADVYAAPAGLHLNPAAYAAPVAGLWGNAGRNSITGPSQFSMNASVGRSFQATDRISLDFRIDASNALNHVTYPSWTTTTSSTQFGLPATANGMRAVQTTIRARF